MQIKSYKNKNTVKTLLSGHLRDLLKCSLIEGVRLIEVCKNCAMFVNAAVDKTRNMEYSGTFPNIPENEKIKTFLGKNNSLTNIIIIMIIIPVIQAYRSQSH